MRIQNLLADQLINLKCIEGLPRWGVDISRLTGGLHTLKLILDALIAEGGRYQSTCILGIISLLALQTILVRYFDSF